MKVFWSGFLMHMGLASIIQDLHGKAGYIQLIEEKWISPAITMPIALLLLILSFYWLYKYLPSDKNP